MKNYVCLTAYEWRNLCSVGRIRLLESRTISCAGHPNDESYGLLFSLSADRFLLGETSDFLIAEFANLRLEIEGIQPPGHEAGVRWLLLQDVVRFFPLRSDDAWAFEADAHKARVSISESLLESHWNVWLRSQLVSQACINGMTLMRSLGLENSTNQVEAFSDSWNALATHIVHPSSGVTITSDFTERIIKSRERLFDLVREDIDSGAFFVSCPIEWINLQAERNIFDTEPDLAERAQCLHEKYFNIAFESALVNMEDIREFESLLLARAPAAFPNAWRPSMISLYVRWGHKIRFDSLGPDEIIAAVRAIDSWDNRASAQLLAFLFGVDLGSNKAHSLERLLHANRFAAVSASIHDSEQLAPGVDTVQSFSDMASGCEE